MPTFQNDPVLSKTNVADRGGNAFGVYGESTLFNAIRGVTYAPGHGAVVGVSENHTPQAGPGVFGQSDGTGVWGQSKTWMGVYGRTDSTTGGAGVMGEAEPGIGVKAVSKDGAGLAAYSTTNEAVHAETHSPGTAAIAAYNLNPSGTGAAVFAKKEGGVGHAGFFDGNVFVTGTITVAKDVVLMNADCAEEFDIEGEGIEPGTVMVLAESGALRPSDTAYDKRVAGVLSGAGDYKPGLVLDRQPGANRRPVALVGKTFCRVDADCGGIEIGDLLTTSPTLGCAMKASDPVRAFGAVIGKALRPLAAGQGLVPILVALQ